MTWKVLSDVLINCKGVTRLTNDDDASDKIIALDLLQPAQRKKVSMRNNSEARTALACLSEVVDTLIPKCTNGGALAWANGDTNDIVEHEMQSAAAAIEAATRRSQKLPQSLSKKSSHKAKAQACEHLNQGTNYTIITARQPACLSLFAPNLKIDNRHSITAESLMSKADSVNQQIELLKCSVPIWPTQLRRYTEIPPLEPHRYDYNVEKMQIDPVRLGVQGDWDEIIHPSGAMYHYNARMKTYAEMNMSTCSDQQLQRLESWINASRNKLDGKQWLLVVEPISVGGREIYPYYYVVLEDRMITWIEPVDGYLLFQECTTVWHWNHKRLELEAQFWKNVEYFPHGIEVRLSEVKALRVQLNWYRRNIEALAIEQSTAAALFWTLDQMKEMAAELATTEELAGPAGIMEQPSVAICGKIMHMLRHHEYLNHHGRPEARLMRTHSLTKRRNNLVNSPFMASAEIVMLWTPIVALKQLRDIYVDGIVNGIDIRGFTEDFNAQSKAQTTVASVILAVNTSILAVPGLGAPSPIKTLCSISFILSVFCIVACTMAQHFGYRLRSLNFAVYYLQGKMAGLAILASIPSFLYLTSLAFAILGFLAGIFTGEFGLALSARIIFVVSNIGEFSRSILGSHFKHNDVHSPSNSIHLLTPPQFSSFAENLFGEDLEDEEFDSEESSGKDEEVFAD
ncbi:hypothetical protein EV424DRAFT_1540227 [Suillus variegatus]|nr:hypothetical protein EV424DRAFT_1540227 [Suillus variegatus]